MTLERRCDYTTCGDPAFFHVGVWSEDAQRLDDDADVCGADHARALIAEWLVTLADVDPTEAPDG